MIFFLFRYAIINQRWKVFSHLPQQSLVSFTCGCGPPQVVGDGGDPLPQVVELFPLTRFVQLFRNRLDEVPDVILVVDSWPFLPQVALHCWRSICCQLAHINIVLLHASQNTVQSFSLHDDTVPCIPIIGRSKTVCFYFHMCKTPTPLPFSP